eukprot:15363288-Ditylum_brightwellii.AAC.1
MSQHKNCITAEMQAEDHYCLLLNKNTVYLWNKGSTKKIPKKHCNNKTYKSPYKKHMEGLKKAFEEGIFEVRYKEEGQEDSKADLEKIPYMQEL